MVVLALTGSFSNYWEWIGTVFGGSGLTVQKATLKCDGYCNSFQTTEQEIFANRYCSDELEIDVDGDGKVDVDERLFCNDITPCNSIDS